MQPSSTDNHFEEEELVLLSSLANEIANIVLTKRLESKLTETDKMRSVGLLAAGIAHNFNNILQAIMGQASLLEMSNDKQPQVLKSAKIIGESATKGAGLVSRQLLSFATFDEPHSQNVQVNDIITEELKRWSAQLSSNQQIKLSSSRNCQR